MVFWTTGLWPHETLKRNYIFSSFILPSLRFGWGELLVVKGSERERKEWFYYTFFLVLPNAIVVLYNTHPHMQWLKVYCCFRCCYFFWFVRKSNFISNFMLSIFVYFYFGVLNFRNKTGKNSKKKKYNIGNRSKTVIDKQLIDGLNVWCHWKNK